MGPQLQKIMLSLRGAQLISKGGPTNFFLPHSRAKMYMFLPIQRVFFKANKVNTRYFGLCGPNRKLPRATNL